MRRRRAPMLVGFVGLLGGGSGDDRADCCSWQAATPKGIQSLASQHLRRRDFPLTSRVREGGSRAPCKFTPSSVRAEEVGHG